MTEQKTNKYGIPKIRPSEVDEEVRRRCGFGCVICGFAIYHYHHFDPPFSELKTAHDPNKITLLCGKHHDLEKRGLLPEDDIKEANENPKCLQDGFSRGPFYIGKHESPTIVLGTLTFINTPTLIEAQEEPLLKIEPPEETEGGPFRLSGAFYDKSGDEIFRIVQNEWRGPVSNWDIEVEGTKITVRRAKRKIALKLRANPPNKLTIERLDMYYKGFQIISKEGQDIRVVDQNGSTIYVNSPSWNRSILEKLDIPFIDKARQNILSQSMTNGVTFCGCEAGIILQEDGKVSLGRNCKSISMGGGGILITR